jgi:hypothetical protein
MAIAMLSITMTRGLRRASADRASDVDLTDTIRSANPARRQARSICLS